MLTVLASIWVLHVAAMVSPGANVLLVSQLAASDHKRSAFLAALGVTVGAAIWASFAVLGVHAVFEAFPQLRLALQVCGGFYLLYVARRLWRSPAGMAGGTVPAVSSFAAFRLGFLTNITNPKSALFFGSVFAASFPADPGPVLQVSAVAMIVLNALCWHSLLAFTFSLERVRIAYARQRRIADRIGALVVGALGLRVLLASWREARL